MELDVKALDRFLSITPQAKSIETFNSREFKIKVIDLINQNHNQIILNLSEVDFIDSNGLGSLIAILKLLTAQQGKIVICGAREPIKRIFNLTRLNQVLQLVESEEDAKFFLEDGPRASSDL